MNTPYLKYIASLVIFGSNGIVASRIAMTSYQIVLSRCFIGSLFLIFLFLLKRKKTKFLQHPGQLLFILLSGTAMGASWMFLFEAYRQIGVSVATLSYYCGPLIVLILAPFVFKEKLTAEKVAGFASVVLGMMLVNGNSVMTGGLSWGLLCGVLSACMYALMVIFSKKAKDITGLENPMIQLTVSFIVVGGFTLFTGAPSFAIPRDSILPILFLGFINTGLGCYLYFSSIQKIPAQSVAIFSYLDPLSALLFSALLLNERLSILQVAGAALILGGAIFAELFQRKTSPLQSASK